MTMGFLQLARPRIAGVMPFRRSDLRNGSRLAVMRVLPRYVGVFATTPSGHTVASNPLCAVLGLA
jgi:hypothetical protein